MSLVRVQLPEPQISADFCGFSLLLLRQFVPVQKVHKCHILIKKYIFVHVKKHPKKHINTEHTKGLNDFIMTYATHGLHICTFLYTFSKTHTQQGFQRFYLLTYGRTVRMSVFYNLLKILKKPYLSVKQI